LVQPRLDREVYQNQAYGRHRLAGLDMDARCVGVGSGSGQGRHPTLTTADLWLNPPSTRPRRSLLSPMRRTRTTPGGTHATEFVT
jgi:hypothetical protein